MPISCKKAIKVYYIYYIDWKNKKERHIMALKKLGILVTGFSWYIGGMEPKIMQTHEKEQYNRPATYHIPGDQTIIFMRLEGRGLESFPDISAMENLVILSLARNAIGDIPKNALDSFCDNSDYPYTSPDLYTSLDLSENVLEEFPRLDTTKNIQRLNFSGNLITTIDGNMLPHAIVVLDLSNNKLIKMPNLRALSNLSMLDLSGNDLELPENMGEYLPPNLTILKLSHCKLKTMPNLTQLKKLSSLHLSKNILKEITVENLPESLTYLYVEKNNITHLPSLQALKQLKVLYLDANPLHECDFTHLPTTLGNLSLAYTNLSRMPVLDQLKNLGKVILSGNNIRELSEDDLPSQLQRLWLNNCSLEVLPDLSQKEHLRELHVDYNRIVRIGQERLPKKLRFLICGHNPLVEFPDIRTCTSLHTLSLSGTTLSNLPLDNLPENLGQLILRDNRFVEFPYTEKLKKLHLLDLSHNQFVELPNLNLPALVTLNLSHNKLTVLDGEILPTELRKLSIQHNRIRKVMNLEKLSNLRILWLSDNDLEILPLSFTTLPELAWLNLINNPIRGFEKNNDGRATVITHKQPLSTAFIRYIVTGKELLQEAKNLMQHHGELFLDQDGQTPLVWEESCIPPLSLAVETIIEKIKANYLYIVKKSEVARGEEATPLQASFLKLKRLIDKSYGLCLGNFDENFWQSLAAQHNAPVSDEQAAWFHMAITPGMTHDLKSLIITMIANQLQKRVYKSHVSMETADTGTNGA